MHPDSLGPLAALLGGTPAQASQQESSSSEREEIQILNQLLDGIQRYLSIEKDAQDRQILATCAANIHKVLAAEQKDNEAVMGNSNVQRVLRKAG